MTFRKPPPPPDEPDEEELERIAEHDDELEAFEHTEFGVFLRLLELHTDVEPSQALEALNLAFYLGLKDRGVYRLDFRGKLPVESAYLLNDWIENDLGGWTYQRLGEAVLATLGERNQDEEISVS